MDKPKLIVFDMDGVIVDVSRSYRDTVRRTARLFFNGMLSEEDLPDPLFSLAELAGVKQAGGLNNDWELTYHVLALLLTKTEFPPEEAGARGWQCHEQLMSCCDVSGLARFLASSGSPLAELHEQYPSPDNFWIARLSEGDVGTGNVIKQMFQEIYLGGALFRTTYGIPSICHRGDGLIDRESLLIPIHGFAALAKEHLLAIATGRPRAEAEHALERFNLQPYFTIAYTLDDCLVEEKTIFEKTGKLVSLSKPHPFMLDTIAQKYLQKTSDLYYIGDMPDDMMAASHSSYAYRGVGILHSAPDRETLRAGLLKAGAADIVEDTDALFNYFTLS